MSQQISTTKVCDVLKQLRGTKSQKAMADLLGMKSQQSYAHYETGGGIPDIEQMKDWARRLGVDYKIFLEPETFFEPSDNYRAVADLSLDLQAAVVRWAGGCGLTPREFVARCLMDHGYETAKELRGKTNSTDSVLEGAKLGLGLAKEAIEHGKKLPEK